MAFIVNLVSALSKMTLLLQIIGTVMHNSCICRQTAQDQAMQEHQSRLDSLSVLAGQLAGREETLIREQLDSVQKRHIQLGQHLLHLVRQASKQYKN